MRPKSKQVRCLQYILMALIAVVSLFPFYALVSGPILPIFPC